MPKPQLPAVLVKDGRERTVHTPNDYYDLVYRGFTLADVEENLTPAQKAARTREANKQQEQEKSSNVPASTPVPAGDAN